MIKLVDILLEADSRTPRKKGQRKKSGKHSDLFTDEDPKGTIHGLGFKNATAARKGITLVNKAKRKHAHKVQATLVMKQRAKVAISRTKDPEKKKDLQAAFKIWSAHLEKLKKKTKKMNESLLVEVSKRDMQYIVNRVYPHIVKDLGGRAVKVEIHNNIYRRLGAVGEEDLMKNNNPYGEYDWDRKVIYLYASAISNVEQIIRSLLHEHTHTLQNRKKFQAGYDSGKYDYKTHPFEKAATRAESKWKKYLKHLDD